MAPTGKGREQGVLSRWSERKRKVAEEEARVAVAAEPAGDNDAEIEEEEPETQEAALELLRKRDPELAERIGKIDIDKLTYDDDFTVFMNKAVPRFIRNRALDKLWLTSPIFAGLDGLNDYDEDFRAVSELGRAVTSAWEPGKGHLSVREDSEEEGGEAEVVAAADGDEGGVSKPAGEDGSGSAEEEVAGEAEDDGDVDDDGDLA